MAGKRSAPSSPGMPAQKVAGPAYDLDKIRGGFRVALVGQKRAQREVTERVGISAPQAERFVRSLLEKLQACDYHTTLSYGVAGEPDADVYLYEDEHGGWYVKFTVLHGRATVSSCHEPDYNATRSDGKVFKGRKDV